MPTTVPSISDVAATLTARNAESDTAPVASASISPFHEVLIADLAVSVPPALREQLRRAGSVPELTEWLTVGTLWRWFPPRVPDPRPFSLDLNGGPRRAAMSVIDRAAVASSRLPTSAKAQQADARGVALVFLGVAALLAARGLIVGVAAIMTTDRTPSSAGDWSLWVSSMMDAPLLVAPPSRLAAWACAGVAGLHVIEARLGGTLISRLRDWPARWAGLRLPPSGRFDALPPGWGAYCWGLGICAWTMAATGLYRVCSSPASVAITPPDVALLIFLAATGWDLIRLVRQCLSFL